MFLKSAVRDRATGDWEAVPMCAMNQNRWSELYRERLAYGGQGPDDNARSSKGSRLRPAKTDILPVGDGLPACLAFNLPA